MLAWMQSDGVRLFLHPEALWVGGVVVLVSAQWVKMDPPSLTQCVWGWEDGRKLVWHHSDQPITTHRGWFPKMSAGKVSFFLFFPIKIFKNWNFESLDPLWPQSILGNTAEWITRCWKQEVNRPIRFSFYLLWSSALAIGWKSFLHQTQRQTHEHHMWADIQELNRDRQEPCLHADSWNHAELGCFLLTERREARTGTAGRRHQTKTC